MKPNVYIYIFIMAGVTYLIRMLPLVLVKKEIQNVTVKSFLYYVPYVTLSVMTFPAILTATNSIISAAAGFIAAVVTAFRGGICLCCGIRSGTDYIKFVFISLPLWAAFLSRPVSTDTGCAFYI